MITAIPHHRACGSAYGGSAITLVSRDAPEFRRYALPGHIKKAAVVGHIT
jgi:hypothetical protein